MNIKELLDRDGIKLKKQSHREFSAPCPWCGGRDRLRVWPDENGGAFWCRVCRKGGDMVRYHMLTAGVGYFDACHALGVEPKFKPRRTGAPTFRPATLPPLQWRDMAKQIVESCNEFLFTEAGADLLRYLAGRGITEKAARRARLGLNMADRFWDRTAWGLPEEIKEETGRPRRVWLPAGLVIPTLTDGEVVRLRVRRAAGDPRYVNVSGSGGHPMKWGRNAAVVVVEAELDAIAISAAAGDIAAVMALGSAQARPDATTNQELRQSDRILLALDYDDAGAAQAPWWTRTYGAKVKRWPAPIGKDPGEAYAQGVDLRAWIKAGVE
jgi:DNA primase